MISATPAAAPEVDRIQWRSGSPNGFMTQQFHWYKTGMIMGYAGRLMDIPSGYEKTINELGICEDFNWIVCGIYDGFTLCS